MWNRFSCILRNRDVRSNWLRTNLVILAVFFPIYLINRCIKTYIDIPFIGYLCNCHLNDFIGGIVFCIYLNILLLLNNKNPISKFSLLLGIMMPVALLWEYFFPLFLPYSTSDILDVVAYLLGTVTYYMLIYKMVPKTTP